MYRVVPFVNKFFISAIECQIFERHWVERRGGGVLIFSRLAGKIIVAVGDKSRSNNFGPLASLTTFGS